MASASMLRSLRLARMRIKPSRLCKVAVVGEGLIGKPLAGILEGNRFVSKVTLYNITAAAEVREEQLRQTLEGSDIVIIPAGVARKIRGMTEDDHFNINAGIVKSLCTAIANYCPNALVNVINKHLNSTVPIAAQVFKKAGTYDEKKLFGVTTSDYIRAKGLYSRMANIPYLDVGRHVPIVGGHAGITILPLYSQARPTSNALSDEDLIVLTEAMQDRRDKFLKKNEADNECFLNFTARAGAIFANNCMRGLNGLPGIVQCSFVQSSITELPFFASEVRLGKNGAEEVLELGPLSDFEKQGLENLKAELKSSIEKGIKFASEN